MAAASASPSSRLFLPKPDTRGRTRKRSWPQLADRVPEQRALPGCRGEIRQVDSGRRFSHTTFHVVNSYCLHLASSCTLAFLNARRQADRVSRARNLVNLSTTCPPQPLATLSALLCQPAQRYQDARGPPRAPTRARIRATAVPGRGVVEVPKHTLELLQRAEITRDPRVVERRRDVDQIAQLLGVYPDSCSALPKCGHRWFRRRWRFVGSTARLAARRLPARRASAFAASGLDETGRRGRTSSPTKARGSGRCSAPGRAGRVHAVAPAQGRPSALPCPRRNTSAPRCLSPRTSTSMSRSGPVSRPSHENSVEK